MSLGNGKLVRDRIPEIITETGGSPQVSTLSSSEYRIALHNKLIEETHELIAAVGDDQIEELADILEVIIAIADDLGSDFASVQLVAIAKREKRGAFKSRIWLHTE